MKVLDTAFILDVLMGVPEAVKKAKELDKGNEAATTAITVYELYFGLYSSRVVDHDRRRLEADRFFSRLEVFPLDKDAAAKAGEVLGHLSREGKLIDLMDGMIGAIALAAGGSGSEVVTRNRSHFERIKGLRVIDY